MAVNTTITTTALIMKKVVAALAIVIIKKKVVATGITSSIGVARGNLTRVVSSVLILFSLKFIQSIGSSRFFTRYVKTKRYLALFHF
ncbi:hypothetical protein [Helicobacter pylori]|uniref:hypothetical protein n=1 Tax=Helicobacter pylori TaxID=210 RepID=UPI0035C14673